MTQELGNLFGDLPRALPRELVDDVISRPQVRIERIVSHGHVSPPGFWYDQTENEWVVVLQGAARMTIDDRREPLEMRPGDYVLLPAGLKHRIDWTTPDEPTVWLAIFWRDPA
ncbi:MAG: cupin domain-containing protein [Pirellula sp.]